MKRFTLPLLSLLACGSWNVAAAAVPTSPDSAVARTADPLAAGFDTPPAQTKPWCYWYWISDNVTREGITRDLEAMARIGIGEALIGNIFQENQPAGSVKVLSDAWWDLIRHALREGGRVGVNIGLFNCPGWSQSGGPWIRPDQAMRHIVSSETRVSGPRRHELRLSPPRDSYQRIAVLAFPAPRNDVDSLAAKKPRVVCVPAAAEAQRLVDGDPSTVLAFPQGAARGKTPFVVELQLTEALTARSLQVFPGEEAFGADCELLAASPEGGWRTVRRFRCDRSNSNINVGPMPRGPVSISFEPVTASAFRLVFTGYFGRGKAPALAEVTLSGAARLESYVEKQLGRMHPTPLPLWDAYLWPAPKEADDGALNVSKEKIRNLTAQVSSEGVLVWDAPPGDWVILDSGMAPTGVQNHPSSPEGRGLEADKMNRAVARAHFDAFIGEVLRRVPSEERRALKRVVADSYETGSQNWTDGFDAKFRAVYGYDAAPWLPVLTGRIVGSADRSERFLWDLRRLVADSVATEYVGGLREACRPHGLELWLENYGHWGFPGEFLKYGGESDRIGGEFWVTGDLGSIECRAASSCANTYGKPIVSAESFTGGPPFQNAPWALKARGDWSFCEGVNHPVLHVYIQQPWEDRRPGINAPWGTEFNRHNTWFERGRAWVDYERRSCWLLQQGWRVADAAYFIGEDAPKMTGTRQPELPPGRDFDYINAEVLARDAIAKDGRLALPHGVSYRVLVLPPQKTMRPELLRRVRDLVRAGVTVYGTPPSSSPSLMDYPRCDEAVRALASEMWGGLEVPPSGTRTFGRGRLVWGRPLAAVFEEMGVPPDVEFRGAAADARFLHTHRGASGAEIYFVSNQRERAERVDGVFRVSGKRPELWDAVTGERRALPQWREESGRVVVPLAFAERQSWFVVFREGAKAAASSEVNFPETRAFASLDEGWSVAFDPKWGGPSATVSLPRLIDWTKHADEGVRHYSGTAVYSKTFELSEAALRDAGASLLIDLGQVRDVATVRLNGRELGTLWTAPWRVNVAGAAKAGSNRLEIEIVNPWNNRLVGDSAKPAAQRLTSISLNTIRPKTQLLPAGLLGPVTLQSLAPTRASAAQPAHGAANRTAASAAPASAAARHVSAR